MIYKVSMPLCADLTQRSPAPPFERPVSLSQIVCQEHWYVKVTAFGEVGSTCRRCHSIRRDKDKGEFHRFGIDQSCAGLWSRGTAEIQRALCRRIVSSNWVATACKFDNYPSRLPRPTFTPRLPARSHTHDIDPSNLDSLFLSQSPGCTLNVLPRWSSRLISSGVSQDYSYLVFNGKVR
jgi:hypothetical protein